MLLTVGAALVVWYPRAAAHTASHDAWVIRQQLARVGFQMAREAPLFGIGVGRFFTESARFASPELRQYYTAQNAHNQVLQILGELGTPWAWLFLALLACSLTPGWRPDAVVTGDGRPLILGLVGWLFAQPADASALVPEVAAAFWLALGLARSTVVASGIDHKSSRVRILVVLLALARGRCRAHRSRWPFAVPWISRRDRGRAVELVFRIATVAASGAPSAM